MNEKPDLRPHQGNPNSGAQETCAKSRPTELAERGISRSDHENSVVIKVGPETATYVDDAGQAVAGVPSENLLLQTWLKNQHVVYEAPHAYARDCVKGFVQQHLHEDCDPDELLLVTLYIYEIDTAPQRANIAFSMTLTDALLRNWQQKGNGQFFDHLGHPREYRQGGYYSRISQTPLPLADCFAYEAIYRKTSPQRFDPSTHVPIDPVVFKQFVWDADLQAHYLKSLNSFWELHGEDYNLLIKAAVLESAYVQHSEGTLSAGDKGLVLRSTGLEPDQAWETLTLEHFTHAPMSSRITFRELILYRYVATDIIVIQDEHTDRLVVYIPGNSSPLHGFDGISALRDWIVLQCKDSRRRKSLETHFRAEDNPDGAFLSGLHTALAGLAAHPDRLNDATGHWWPDREINLGAAITPWPFSHFKANLQDRLASDGKQLIHSQADYNKEMASQMLTNAILATGVIAMVAPVLWIPLVAMSLALIGMGVDEVVEGRTENEKEDGIGRIVFGVLNAGPIIAIEGGSAIAGLAARAGDGLAPGAADEVGQMVGARSAEERAADLTLHAQSQDARNEDALERAAETSEERQSRLDQEEQSRLADQAHRQSTFDSAVAFGVEPEGLRSLTLELRAELAKFEYTGSLPPPGAAGEWSVDDFGAVYTANNSETGGSHCFARVHAKVYRVERVESVGQYRIVSPDPTCADELEIHGPYVKPVKGYYSDIDIRPGLRGGESLADASSGLDSLPGASKPGIVLAPGQHSPTTIEIPMDGIEVQSGFDDDYKPADQYCLRYKGEKIRVRYDADRGCWQRSDYEFYWRDNKGSWKRGREKDYLRVRKRLNLGVSSETYKFPVLPGYPEQPQAIELSVHQIWLGDRLPRAELIETMKSNMRLSPNVNFTLHIDIDSNEILEELLPKAQLQSEFAELPNVTVSNLQDEVFFQAFTQQPKTSEPFYYFRTGQGQNLAAASDVLRYRLIREYGGIYMDCDDAMTTSFDGAQIKAGPSDVLVGKIITSERAAFIGPNNSNFASLPGNPVLREIQEELYARFAAQRDALTQLKGASPDPATGLDPYMVKIFEVTGPRFFLDTLKHLRADIGAVLDGSLKPKWGIRSLIYREYGDDLRDFYAPFRHRLPIEAGRENSWLSPAT